VNSLAHEAVTGFQPKPVQILVTVRKQTDEVYTMTGSNKIKIKKLKNIQTARLQELYLCAKCKVTC